MKETGLAPFFHPLHAQPTKESGLAPFFRWLLVQAVVVAALAFAAAAPAVAAPRERACSVGAAPAPVPARCFTQTVPLDRSGYVIGNVRLAGARIAARRGRRSTTAVVALAGGPGQAALPFAGGLHRRLQALARSRDLIVFDQRGTGKSGALRCRDLERLPAGSSTSIAAAGCAEELGARRRSYTTADTVADLEALRAAYGYRRLAFYGISYGTYVAQEYARTHPDRVERLVLDAVVPANGIDPLYLDGLQAAEQLLDRLCRRGRRCSATADLRRLLTDLGDAALSAASYEGARRPRTRRARAFDLYGVIAAGDFDAALRTALPAALHNAVAGDRVPLIRLVQRARLLGVPGYRRQNAALGYNALFAATICEESQLPWPRESEFHDRARLLSIRLDYLLLGAWSRATVVQSDLAALCYRWPTSTPRPAVPRRPLPDVPALILNGTRDVRTPVAGARAVAAELPRAVLVTQPVGHGVLATCRSDPIADWLRGRKRPRCRARRASDELLPFPRTIAEAKPARGIAGRRGRAVTVAMLAIDDALSMLPRGTSAHTRQAARSPAACEAARCGSVRGRLTFRRIRFTTDLTISGSRRGRRAAPAPTGRPPGERQPARGHARPRQRATGRPARGRPPRRCRC